MKLIHEWCLELLKVIDEEVNNTTDVRPHHGLRMWRKWMRIIVKSFISDMKSR